MEKYTEIRVAEQIVNYVKYKIGYNENNREEEKF